jgi:hypothetical protein
MMPQVVVRFPLPLLALLLVLAGCASPGSGWRKDPRLCRTVGFLGGVAVGIAAASKDSVSGALIGGAAGALLGHLACSSLPGEIDLEVEATPLGGRAPLRVEFHAVAQGATQLTWDLGDGTRAEGHHIEHVYRGQGTFYVSIVASDGSGRTARRRMRITVLAPQ